MGDRYIELMANIVNKELARDRLKSLPEEKVLIGMSDEISTRKSEVPSEMLVGWSGDNADPDNWLGTLFACDAISGGGFSKCCYKV